MSIKSVDEEEKVGVEELECDQLSPKKDVVLRLRRKHKVNQEDGSIFRITAVGVEDRVNCYVSGSWNKLESLSGRIKRM
jgi:hypothetical protein